MRVSCVHRDLRLKNSETGEGAEQERPLIASTSGPEAYRKEPERKADT